MRALIMSDVHFEFHGDGGYTFVQNLKKDDIDIAILAGDVGTKASLFNGLRYFCDKFSIVVYVLGNHEYYASSFVETNKYVSTGEMKSLSNLYLLNNDMFVFGDRRFIGTTLWFSFDPLNKLYEDGITDFALIEDIHHVYQENERSKEFLSSNIQAGDVVVTHHLPTSLSIHPYDKGNPVNRFYFCELRDLIVDKKPDLWIHGHTHRSCDYILGETRIVCNPFGYLGQLYGYEDRVNRDFKNDLVIEI